MWTYAHRTPFSISISVLTNWSLIMLFSSSLIFHRQNVHWPSFKEAAAVKQPCLHGAKSSQTWWQNCGFLQWRGIMSPLSFPRSWDLATLHSRSWFYLARSLSNNEQKPWEPKLFLLFYFAGPCGDCSRAYAAVLPGEGGEETKWSSSDRARPRLRSALLVICHQYVAHTLCGSKLLRSES